MSDNSEYLESRLEELLELVEYLHSKAESCIALYSTRAAQEVDDAQKDKWYEMIGIWQEIKLDIEECLQDTNGTDMPWGA